MAKQRGYVIVETIEENDTGASTNSTKLRKKYDAMLDGARAGRFDVILAYSNSRLTRRPRENETLIELHKETGVRIETKVSGDDDLATADGRMVARIKGDVDAAEAERASERTTDALRHRVEVCGLPTSGLRFGWRVVKDTRTPRSREEAAGIYALDEAQAAVIREAAHRVLKGQSLYAIAQDFNDRGVVKPPRGADWNLRNLHRILRRANNAGRVEYQGRTLAGSFPAILDEGTFDGVVAILSDPRRTTNPNPTRETAVVHYLSGVIRCGKRLADGTECGGALRVKKDGTALDYGCRKCLGVTVRKEPVERYVQVAVLDLLASPEAPDLFAGDPEAAAELRATITGLQARQSSLTRSFYQDQLMSEDDYREQAAWLRDQLVQAEERLTKVNPEAGIMAPWTDGLPEDDNARREEVWLRWKAADPLARRDLTGMLLTVTALPATRRGRVVFDPSERLRIVQQGRTAA